MKIRLHTEGRAPVIAALPWEGCEFVRVARRCDCGSNRVRSDEAVRGHNTVTGAAYCFDCKDPRGTLVVTLDTIFGLEEDAAILTHGRARVY